MSRAPIVGNRGRSALHSERIPDGPLTDRQRTLADAVRHCHSLSDFTAAPEETVTSIEVARIPLGMPDSVAEPILRRGIAHARARLQRMEGLLDCYGAAAFSPHSEPVDASGLGVESRHAVLVALFRRLTADKRVLTRAGDRHVLRAADGGYVLAPVPLPQPAGA